VKLDEGNPSKIDETITMRMKSDRRGKLCTPFVTTDHGGHLCLLATINSSSAEKQSGDGGPIITVLIGKLTPV
jgi:hypothetical protein